AEMRVAGDHHGADFVRSHRGDIKLTLRAPLDLHVFTPRRDPVVAAETEATAIPVRRLQSGPAPDGGAAAVRADNPARPYVVEVRNVGSPSHAHAEAAGALQHHPVEHGA